jgi:hypothetical protein
MILPTVQNPQERRTIFEAILARRSARAYAQGKLARRAAQTLLEAAV